MATSDILKYLINMQLHLRAVVPLMKLLVFVLSSREVYFKLKLSTKKFVFLQQTEFTVNSYVAGFLPPNSPLHRSKSLLARFNNTTITHL